MTGVSKIAAPAPPSIHEITDLRRIRLEGVAEAAVPSVVRLSPGHGPHGQVRYLWTDQLPDDFAAVEAASADCAPFDLVALPEVEVRSDWMPYREGGAIVGQAFYPPYVRQYYETNDIRLYRYPNARRIRRISAPMFVVSHFNMRTYGHFLLEVLPKCLLIQELYKAGLSYRVAFPASQPGLARIIRMACPDIRLFIYNDHRERLSVKLALLPTALISPSAHFHDLAVAGFRMSSLRLTDGLAGARRLFLSRRGVRSFRTLHNEAELAEIARGYGFDVIQPETLPWAEQVRLFSAASHVVGEFSSALHNTVFSPASTKVVALNWWAPVQSALASALGHEIGYIMPKDGVRTRFLNGWTETQPFDIDPALFRERLEQLGLEREPGR